MHAGRVCMLCDAAPSIKLHPKLKSNNFHICTWQYKLAAHLAKAAHAHGAILRIASEGWEGGGVYQVCKSSRQLQPKACGEGPLPWLLLISRERTK